jgi:hypothetical protein
MRTKSDTKTVNRLLFAMMLIGFAGVVMAEEGQTGHTVQVSGTGVDLLNGTVVHSKKETATGIVQHGTEVVELSGDLTGKVLYHVTTVIDNQKQTLTNTGDQVFSGTIKGSESVMLHDSRFKFVVNLATGAEAGSVYLSDHIAGPAVTCELKVTGSGKAADGNPTFNYTGSCRFGPDKSAARK